MLPFSSRCRTVWCANMPTGHHAEMSLLLQTAQGRAHVVTAYTTLVQLFGGGLCDHQLAGPHTSMRYSEADRERRSATVHI